MLPIYYYIYIHAQIKSPKVDRSQGARGLGAQGAWGNGSCWKVDIRKAENFLQKYTPQLPL